MRFFKSVWVVICMAVMLAACVEPLEVNLTGTVNVIVVVGTISNLPEPQVIRLNRSQADRLTGQFSTVPITKASVEVVVDSSQVIACHETLDGSYQLPNDFRGQVGHAYQLRFTMPDGTQFESTQQVMPPGPPIDRVSVRFNTNSLPVEQLNGYRAAHDFFVDAQDPADQRNYYRWEWKLWERQFWCHSCRQGVYSKYKVLPNVYRDRDYFVTGTELYEACFSPPAGKAGEEAPEVPKKDWIYDYGCETPCWQIVYGYNIVLFDDKFTNGGLISQQRVAQVPFYNPQPGLVDIRQFSLTADAYRYYRSIAEQTQPVGGLTDTPPTALQGNVRSVKEPRVGVVGYFTASAVSLVHYWLDRKDVQGFVSYGATFPVDTISGEGGYGKIQDGLFYSLKARQPNPEPPPPYLGERDRANVRLWPYTNRPPLVPCRQTDNQTPFKPEGWRE